MTEQKKYDNNNEIAIWPNDRKNKPTDPDFKGNATIDGKEFWVSAWKRDEGANERAPILKAKLTAKEAPKDQAQYSGNAQPAPAPDPVTTTNNAIPF